MTLHPAGQWTAQHARNLIMADALVIQLHCPVFRGDQAKDAELLVLRHENAMLAALVRIPTPGPAYRRLVSPGTVLRRHRLLAARRWRQPQAPGRPSIGDDLTALIVRLATESMSWRDQQIQVSSGTGRTRA